MAWIICRPETPNTAETVADSSGLGVFEGLLQPLLLAGLLPDQVRR